MSMPSRAIPAIPEETIRVARVAFPHGNIYLTMRDQLGTLYEDEHFATLFPKRGRLRNRPGNLRWSVCSNLWKDSLIGKQQRLSGAELTGNTHCPWI